MNTSPDQIKEAVYKQSYTIWILLGGIGLLLALIYLDGIKELIRIWGLKEEYSYGYLVPFVTIFFIWQKKEVLQEIEFKGSWAGIALILFGILLYVVGELSTLYLIVQYSLLFVIYGLALSFMGWKAFRIIFIPLLILWFMIPLPQFFLREISNQLQLISSSIGVYVIRLFGISVYLEGNVIDLGTYKLQVVEACNGLRYLFPLMTLGFIVAYLYQTKLWKRIVLFLSTIPITILMNSFRIGAIGVMVEYWGNSMAQGFLHDFEGWVIFMACTVVLIAEMWVLNKLGHENRPLREVFGLEFPEARTEETNIKYRKIPGPLILSAVIVISVASASFLLPDKVEVKPMRMAFSEFPMELGAWRGQKDRLERIILNELKLDDYIIVDYLDDNRSKVNFYSAYYASQKKGQSAHSPRTCIPGGGWKVKSFSQTTVDGLKMNGVPLSVNRIVIQMGEAKQLVYYWFQQRNRIITNEYLVKWYIFWDALTRNRTDGALVRLITPIGPREDLTEGDKRLADFGKIISPHLTRYIPD